MMNDKPKKQEIWSSSLRQAKYIFMSLCHLQPSFAELMRNGHGGAETAQPWGVGRGKDVLVVYVGTLFSGSD